jgi:hypothetical protein
MIHNSIGASRKVSRIIGAVSGPLLAISAASLSNPASAGGSALPDPQPALRGSYCAGSAQDLALPTRAGCDERIGGRSDPFAPIEEPAIAGNQTSSVTIVGAPTGGGRFLLPASPADIAR